MKNKNFLQLKGKLTKGTKYKVNMEKLIAFLYASNKEQNRKLKCKFVSPGIAQNV